MKNGTVWVNFLGTRPSVSWCSHWSDPGLVQIQPFLSVEADSPPCIQPLQALYSLLILYMELSFQHAQENVKQNRIDGKIKQQQNFTSPRRNGLAELDTNDLSWKQWPFPNTKGKLVVIERGCQIIKKLNNLLYKICSIFSLFSLTLFYFWG